MSKKTVAVFFEDNKTASYSEMTQANPIRWQVYKKESEEKFVAQTAKFKCRDFFNDVVTVYHCQDGFSIYGFGTQPSMFNSKDGDGLPLMLHSLCEKFAHNMEGLNGYLVDNNMPVLVPEYFDGMKECFVYIPREYLRNTYLISGITLLIRVANYVEVDMKNMTMDQVLKAMPQNADHTLLSGFLKKGGIKLDKKYDEYIWYYTDKLNYKHGNNLKEICSYTSYTHNCGQQAWKI